MPRTLNRLSPLKVGKLRGRYADGGGLYLRISDSGTKGWIFRYTDDGKLHDMGLGPVHTISLPRARELGHVLLSSLSLLPLEPARSLGRPGARWTVRPERGRSPPD